MKDGQTLKLKRHHSYYTQVQGQLAVTGLQWCDFLCGVKMIFIWKPSILIHSIGRSLKTKLIHFSLIIT